MSALLTRIFGASSSSRCSRFILVSFLGISFVGFIRWPFVGPRMGQPALRLSVLDQDQECKYGPDARCGCPCWPFFGPRMDLTVRCSTVRVRDDHTSSSKRRVGTLLYGAGTLLYGYGTTVTTLPVLPYRFCRIDLIGYYFLTINRLVLQDFYYSFGVHVVPSPLQHNVGKVV
jgi:hypothetical protein